MASKVETRKLGPHYPAKFQYEQIVRGQGPVGMLNMLYPSAEAYQTEMTEHVNATENGFKCKIKINGIIFTGGGNSKKKAKCDAALKALKHHKINPEARALNELLKKDKKWQQQQGKLSGSHDLKTSSDNLKDNGNVSISHDWKTFGANVKENGNISGSNDWKKFCANFRDNRCLRYDCKYLHVSRTDEDLFFMSGKVPSHILEQAVRKASINDITSLIGFRVCKAHIDGKCNWQSCPFRHIDKQEFIQIINMEIYKGFNGLKNPKSLQGNSGYYNKKGYNEYENLRGYNKQDDPQDYNTFQNSQVNNRYHDSQDCTRYENHKEYGRRELSENLLGYSKYENHKLYDGRELSGSLREDFSGRLYDDYSLAQDMRNMKVSNYGDPKQNQMIEDLQEQLRHLQDENRKLRGNNMQPANRDLYGQPMSSTENGRMQADYVHESNRNLYRHPISQDRNRMMQTDYMHDSNRNSYRLPLSQDRGPLHDDRYSISQNIMQGQDDFERELRYFQAQMQTVREQNENMRYRLRNSERDLQDRTSVEEPNTYSNLLNHDYERKSVFDRLGMMSNQSCNQGMYSQQPNQSYNQGMHITQQKSERNDLKGRPLFRNNLKGQPLTGNKTALRLSYGTRVATHSNKNSQTQRKPSPNLKSNQNANSSNKSKKGKKKTQQQQKSTENKSNTSKKVVIIENKQDKKNSQTKESLQDDKKKTKLESDNVAEDSKKTDSESEYETDVSDSDSEVIVEDTEEKSEEASSSEMKSKPKETESQSKSEGRSQESISWADIKDFNET